VPIDPLQVLVESLGPPWARNATPGTAGASAAVTVDGHQLAYLKARASDRGLLVGWSVGPWPAYDRAIAARMVGAVIDTASRCTDGGARLHTLDPLARYEARRAGFRGPLRRPLTLGPSTSGSDIARPRPGHVEDSPADAARDRPARLARELEGLLPDIRFSAAPLPGLMRKVVQRAMSGVGARMRLDAHGAAGDLRILVPARGDVIAEAVAMAVDTAMAIKARFREVIAGVRTVSFDLGERGMSSNHIAGVANTTAAAVQLNAAYCCADLLPGLLYGHAAPRTAHPSALTSAEYRIDKVTAHEFGHYFDFSFQAGRYRESMDFRRRLGETLGVATLEMAVRGDAPEARARLARDVSPYATTNIHEAMAELFAVWWFGGSRCGPVVQCYDRLVEQYFPAPT
jgi:hypothetical protein